MLKCANLRFFITTRIIQVDLYCNTDVMMPTIIHIYH